MLRIAYVDAFSGASGDMMVGALLDCGLELAALEAELAKLPVEGYTLRLERRVRSGIDAAKFVVDTGPEPATSHHQHHDHSHARIDGHPHRPYRDIRSMIERSRLEPRVVDLSLRIFARLAEAEGKVHGMPPDDVEFHEVGAIDSIVDVVGAAWGIAAHGIEELVVSPLPLGQGGIWSAHGRLPVPGPATAELLRGFVVKFGDGKGEMVTPTGAAIVSALGRPAEAPEKLTIERVGYGAGDRELEDRPNLLRLLIGTSERGLSVDSLFLLETNLDDLNPELYEYVMERLFAAGARDVYLTPVQMKKSRPGVVLSVLADAARRDALASILFSETSTLGVRSHPVTRLAVEREVREVETRHGKVRIKVGRAPDGTVNFAPEYEDCKRIAVASGTPLKIVYQEALAAALSGS